MLTVVILALVSVVSARSVPYYFNGHVAFDHSATAEVPQARAVSQDFTEGSLQDMDYLRWVYVTREGYEYEGTLAEVQQHLGHKELTKVIEAHKNHRSQRTIFDTDDRIEVADTEVSPYDAIGKLANGCTGTFIASKTVLTAGHCVYNIHTRLWYSNLNIQRKNDCNPDEGVEHTWNKALVAVGWHNNGWEAYDFAVVFYNEESPDIMPFGYNDDLGLDNAMIVGYPSDKTGSCQWKCEDPLKVTWDLLLGYHCDTYHGMNGGPIIMDNNAGTKVIYGVHTRDRTITVPYNTGPRITSSRFTLITSWIDENN